MLSMFVMHDLMSAVQPLTKDCDNSLIINYICLWLALYDATRNFNFVKTLTNKPNYETEEQRVVRHKLKTQCFGEATTSICRRKGVKDVVSG